MAVSKTAKLEAEISALKEKISEFQTKLKELENKKTAVENTEIIEIVRGMSIPIDELASFLKQAKGVTNRSGKKPEQIKQEEIEGGTEQ